MGFIGYAETEQLAELDRLSAAEAQADDDSAAAAALTSKPLAGKPLAIARVPATVRPPQPKYPYDLVLYMLSGPAHSPAAAPDCP